MSFVTDPTLPSVRRLLAYAPGHPFVAEALRAVTSAVLTTFREHTWMSVISMTGPDRFHFFGVQVVLERNGCADSDACSSLDSLLPVRSDVCSSR